MRLSRLGLRLGVFVGMLFGEEVSIMKLVVHSRPSGLALCVGRLVEKVSKYECNIGLEYLYI
jgi:hypothetical protein